MCGITGIISLSGAGFDPAVLQQMNDSQAHRGPDGEGFLLAWRDGARRPEFRARAADWHGDRPPDVGLGHRRLAILDLTDRGLQPMTVPAHNVWIVFNGEIYNHIELRRELEAEGVRFTSRTDTEVLLQSYLRWGEACLQRLVGMYGFAVWDGRRGTLFCARDRLGIKPLYYATTGGFFLFASEIKALLPFPGLGRDPDDEGVRDFLAHGNCDYGERTLFRQVRALPPAGALTVNTGTGRVDTRTYWHLAPRPHDNGSDSARLADLQELLTDTARHHLISDVQAGSCLSGGLDSSTIVSIVGRIWHDQPEAASALGDRFHTFTSCYDVARYDEREYAQAVAQAVGATTHLVFPTAADFWDVFERMTWHQDMPFPRLSFYAQWTVMRAARAAGVKVLLDGQGGDEVFGGYAKFRYAYFGSLLRAGHLATLAREVAATVRQGDRYVLDIRNGYRYLPRRLRSLLGMDSAIRDVLRADWARAVASESTPGTRWWRYATTSDATATPMQRIQIDDIRTDTLPMLLRMEDRSSMAFSLEARVPLLDHRVVEFGVSLPDRLKFHRGRSKYAMREAMRGWMPESVRLRTGKMGFAAPDRQWLTHDLRPQVTAFLRGDLRAERYVDGDRLRAWYASPKGAGATADSYLGFFRILALEMWMRVHNVP